MGDLLDGLRLLDGATVGSDGENVDGCAGDSDKAAGLGPAMVQSHSRSCP
jgi:hypothetical protein